MSGGKERIGGLDGLRALSVLAVFLGHTGLVPVPGGFIGVDVFFVLSGFLITRILTAEFAASRDISLMAFYARRARRLYPALILVLVGVAVYIWSFNAPQSAEMETLPALFYVMNWVRGFKIYDAAFTGHTWSLGIEEQFYLIWPIMLLVLLRMSARHVVHSLFALIGVVIVWRCYLMNVHYIPARVYCGFDTHCDGLLAGALLSMASRETARKLGAFWPLAALYVAAVLVSKAGAHVAYSEFGFTLTALAAASLIAKVVTDQGGAVVRVLNTWPLAALGRVSYGFYLWHYVVIHVLLYGGARQYHGLVWQHALSASRDGGLGIRCVARAYAAVVVRA
ncbi:peptidoglycan/LPS O-acetylase OafA/YrhL [Paraburkholderia sp. BL6665CI2N2]|uniref:acyltransferase family protein n=1 Tax=Paraburkholderia sp. BL6665CI2N2 TaxID=1938806 RepID=UPI0010655BDF|nr:acyltransferase [Paraburkholderia sp. BL6665CI2N2]TDY26369.1 peptidoglycan/LPS O-acetylase OafA/YrhL [Paraburkholderia sp. BL6665CI2N2]